MSSKSTTKSGETKNVPTETEVRLRLFHFLPHFFVQIDAFQGLDVSRLSNEDIIARTRLLDNEIRVSSIDDFHFVSTRKFRL